MGTFLPRTWDTNWALSIKKLSAESLLFPMSSVFINSKLHFFYISSSVPILWPSIFQLVGRGPARQVTKQSYDNQPIINRGIEPGTSTTFTCVVFDWCSKEAVYLHTMYYTAWRHTPLAQFRDKTYPLSINSKIAYVILSTLNLVSIKRGRNSGGKYIYWSVTLEVKNNCYPL